MGMPSFSRRIICAVTESRVCAMPECLSSELLNDMRYL